MKKLIAVLLVLCMSAGLCACIEKVREQPPRLVSEDTTPQATQSTTPKATLATTPKATPEATPQATPAPTLEPTKAPSPEPTEAPKVKESAEVTMARTVLAEIEKVAGEEVVAKPLFWKVTGPEGMGTIYMLGSFHMTDAQAYKVHPTIMEAYRASDRCAFEFDLIETLSDTTALMAMYMSMLNPNGEKLETIVGKELYDKMKAFLEESGNYMAGLEYYGPNLWDSLISQQIYAEAGIGEVSGYDEYFNSLAYLDGKGVLGVESYEFQNDLLQQQDVRSVIMGLEEMMDETGREELVGVCKDLYNSWLNGDEKALMELLGNDYSDPEFLALDEDLQENIKVYNRKMVEERNYGMARAYREYIKQGGTTFCVVGTAHYLGAEGIVSLLRQEGFNVEKITLE